MSPVRPRNSRKTLVTAILGLGLAAGVIAAPAAAAGTDGVAAPLRASAHYAGAAQEDQAQVGDLFSTYCDRLAPVELPDFLYALATAVAQGWLVAE